MPNDKVNQSEIANEVAAELGVPARTMRGIVQAVVDATRDHVMAGHTVRLSSFLRIGTKSRKPRKARNPRTGTVVTVPARTAVTVKASVPFKRELNDGRFRRSATTRVKQRAKALRKVGK